MAIRSIDVVLVGIFIACAQCDTCAGGNCDDSYDDDLTLLQVKVSKGMRTDETPAFHMYRTSSWQAEPALEYYRKWSLGRVTHSLSTEVDLELLGLEDEGQEKRQKTQLTSAQAKKLLWEHRARKCPDAALTKEGEWLLHDEAADSTNNVRHTLLRSPEGLLQYIAARGSHLLAADPPVCARAHGSPVFLENVRKTKKGEPKQQVEAGEPHIINVHEDKLAKDCMELFKIASGENCPDKKFKLKMKSATMQEIDGFAVHFTGEITEAGSGKKPALHEMTCRFEVNTDRDDASLLQNDVLPEEKAGLIATLVMHTPLCSAADKSDVTPEEAKNFLLLDTYGMGELSLYKGFEHLNDGAPEVATFPANMLGGAEAPAEVDLREKFSMCYPDSGKEVVRNQGGCGSCWAFASATAAMHGLCVSGMGGSTGLASPTDRFEISVAQIMACNDGQRGCQGGTAMSAHNAMKAKGITKESHSSYMCAGGNPLNHFDEESTSCSSFPWGRNCDGDRAFDQWKWGGAVAINGADNMVTMMAAGHALYVSFTVYANFMSGGHDSVYNSLSGGQKGGHAVVLMGYGVEGGEPYWHLQNSWGKGWANNGYNKFLRGTNLANIESGAFYMRAWAEGGTIAPCFEALNTGVRLQDGNTVTCAQAARYRWCSSTAWFGDQVRNACPKSCNIPCVAGTGDAANWGKDNTPTSAPTDAPTESPTEGPTESPTDAPTESPTDAPTETPTEAPTDAPTEAPTDAPTDAPTESPTDAPTESPTDAPTESPTGSPTETCSLLALTSSTPNAKCVLDAQCCASSLQYTNSEGCDFTVGPASLKMNIVKFETESSYDRLRVWGEKESVVSEHKISGMGNRARDAYDGMIAQKDRVIRWSSDESVTTDGWKICFSEELPQ